MNLDMTYEQAVQEARERQGEREISDDAARVLTAAWYAPSVPAMVAIATGAWSPESLIGDEDTDTGDSRGEQYRVDLYRTFRAQTELNGNDSEEMIIWSALITWSMNGGDNDEF